MQTPFIKSLRFKIGVGYIVLVVINVLVTVWTVYNFGRLTYAINGILNDNLPNVIAVENMAHAIERHEHAISSVLNGDLNNGKIELTEAKDEFFQSFHQADDNKVFPDAAEILKSINSTYEGYLLLTDSLMELAEGRRFEEAKMFYYNTLVTFAQRLAEDCFWLLEENQKQVAEYSRRTKAIAEESIIAVLFGALLALGLSIVTIVQFTRRIIKPAERLTRTVYQIGRGRLDLKIDVETNDEIGELSREFNKMTERLRRFEAMNIEKILLEKQKSETIVGSISDAIIVCDAENRVQLLNRSAENMLAIHEQDAVGRMIEELTTDERLLTVFRKPNDPAIINQPYVEFKSNGRIVYLRPRVSEIPSRAGGREGVVLVLQDVTQFKELDKAKSTFMATVSHEFRTPLTSINMGVDLLRQDVLGPLTPAQADMVDSFKQDCERLTKLVRDLLQLSKLESGRLEMKEEIVDLNKVVESTLQSYHLHLKEKGLALKRSIPESLPMLVCNEQHLSWVISNLVNNAVRHTNAEGTVEIGARVQNESVLVYVRDTGKGIPPEFLDKIFDKFVQVKQTNDTTPGSVGLGLAIAKDIVEMYGGSIWVESEVNKGSIFSFLLPAEQSRTA